MLSRSLCAVTACTATLFAQEITTSLTPLADLACTASVGGPPTTATHPGGALPSFGAHQAVAFGGGLSSAARCQWSLGGDAYAHTCELSLQVSGDDLSCSGDTGMTELRFALEAADAEVPVRYTISFTGPDTQVSGCYAMAVDVGDDGVTDWSPFATSTFQGSAVLGAEPLAFRLLGALFHMGTGDPKLTLQIRVEPDLGVDVQQVADGCAPGWAQMCVSPGSYQARVPFFQPHGGDVDLQLDASTLALPVQVLGLAAAPTPLTPLGLPGSCVGVPSADVVVVQPLLSIPIPAAARPVTFYAQSFSLSASPWLNLGVASGRAYRVSAH